MVLQTRVYLTRAAGATALLAALCTSASPAISGNDLCHAVVGKAVWTVVPSANDPFGRTVGPTTGVLRGASSGVVTSLVPQPDGSLKATSLETWVLGPQDILQFAGEATFTPIAGAPIGTVSNSLTLTVTGGTGTYAGATGSIIVAGTGYNLFGPSAGPGFSFFDLRYEGTVCTVN